MDSRVSRRDGHMSLVPTALAHSRRSTGTVRADQSGGAGRVVFYSFLLFLEIYTHYTVKTRAPN